MIRDLNKYIEGLWNWDEVSEVLPGRARIGDIDGALERRGKLLMLETKRPGVEIPKGQAIMFDNLRKTGIVSTIVIWGPTDSPQSMQIFAPDRVHPKRPATIDDVRQAVAQWFAWASKQPKPE